MERKVAMISGAANGIGAAAARRFSAEGIAVAICDRDEEAGAKLAATMAAEGHRVSFFPMDVADSASVTAAVSSCVEEFGRLDYGINNAGIRSTLPITELSEEEWSEVINVNLTGVFRCMRAQIPHVIEARGAIVNTSSVWGLTGWPTRTAYSAAKHGVAGLTRSAAHDLGQYGVRVNAVAPGPTATEAVIAIAGDDGLKELLERTALKKAGTPDDVADAMYYLCSAGNITGTVLSVDGGWSAI